MTKKKTTANAKKAFAQKAAKHNLALIDPRFKQEIANVLTYGEEKYGTHEVDGHWHGTGGMSIELYMAAMERHLDAVKMGEDVDEETGLPHMAHVATCAMIIQNYLRNDTGNDDRRYAE